MVARGAGGRAEQDGYLADIRRHIAMSDAHFYSRQAGLGTLPARDRLLQRFPAWTQRARQAGAASLRAAIGVQTSGHTPISDTFG